MAKIPWHFFKIPWQFPDLEKILFFPDFSLTRGNPEEDEIWNNEQSETRKMWKKYNIRAEQSKAGHFLEKYEIWALKFFL